jgi:hypothetical protein
VQQLFSRPLIERAFLEVKARGAACENGAKRA